MPLLLVILLFFVASCSPKSAHNAQLADLEFARTNYVLKSKAFAAADREKALQFIDQLKPRTGHLSNEQFLVSMLQLTGFAHNAHDSFDPAGGWIPTTRLPFRMIWFPDAMVIARGASGDARFLGAKVKSIEGLSPDELLARLRPVCGGPDEYVRWNVLWVIENGGLLHALGLAKAPDQLEFKFILSNGTEVTRIVSFVPRNTLPPGVRPPRLWSADLCQGEAERRWRAAIDSARQPFYLQKGDEPFRMERLPNVDALYVQLRANSTADAGGNEIGPFVKRVVKEMETNRPNNLVLDLRFDIGGDIDETRGLAQVMAANTQKRIYLLIGPYTFSAGIVMAAAMKHDGGERVTTVGDRVGDNLRWWSETNRACLPRSGYCLHGTTGLWDLIKGCGGEPDCYGDKYNAKVGSLEPDVRAPLTAFDWMTGRDPALQEVITQLEAPAR